MAEKTQGSNIDPRESDLVYGLVGPYSFLDIFAYFRFSGPAEVTDARLTGEDAEFYSYRNWRAARSECA